MLFWSDDISSETRILLPRSVKVRNLKTINILLLLCMAVMVVSMMLYVDAGSPQTARIVWVCKATGFTGHGEWGSIGSRRAALEHAEREYGDIITHRIEYRYLEWP